MFDHVRLDGHRGVRAVVLSGFGQLNVICGPNNSGKSTVLECLCDEKRHKTGRILVDTDIERLEDDFLAGGSWSHPSFSKVWRESLKEIAASRPFWFSDHGPELWSSMFEKWRTRFNNTLGNEGRFHHSYSSLFPVPPKTVLIPAKRRLDSSVAVDSSQEIHPSGTGILNFLFFAKNQSPVGETRKVDEIHQSFATITAGHSFDAVLRTENRVELMFRAPGGRWVPADDCGLGLRDLLTVLYYGIAANEDVVLIEEPENHLHADWQRRLALQLKALSHKQFVVTTHSNVFLNPGVADRVWITRWNDAIEVVDGTRRMEALHSLGYSVADNLVSDVVVLCEGPGDSAVLEEVFRKCDELRSANVKIWPLGGDIMDQLDLSVFGDAFRVIAIVDRDPGSASVRRRFIEKCAAESIPVHQLTRYSIENYFSLDAISKVVQQPIPQDITELKPNVKVSKQLGFEVKRCGRQIVREMSIDEIRATDLGGFLDQLVSRIQG